MSGSPSQPGVIQKPHDTIRTRCRKLHLPFWACDSNGNVLNEPSHPAELRAWLQSPVLRHKIENAVRATGGVTTSRRIELFDGCRLLVLPIARGSCCLGTTAVMLLDHRASDAQVFREICQAVGLNASTIAEAMNAVARTDLTEITTALQWSYEDLTDAELNHRTLDEFGERLAQSYEETTMLFRLARLLNHINRPNELMRLVSDMLQQVLPFQWVALRFHPGAHTLPAITGHNFIAGRLPCDESEFNNQLLTFMSGWESADSWTRILLPSSNSLAALAGSEVIAESIAHDDQIIGVLLAGKKLGDDADISSAETQFLDATAEFLGIFHENMARFAEQRAMFLGTIRALTASIDAKDPYTCGHSERVSQLAYQFAVALKLTAEQAERYRLAGTVHDVGKIGVPEAVLCKAGRLTEEEFAQMKRHPQVGYDILKDIPPIQDLLPGVLHHHERWDGNGYPGKLSGEKIPLLARVLTLADSFDAMSSNRSYRAAMPRDKVFEEIHRCSGSQFDAALVPVFLSLDFSMYDAMVAAHQSQTRAAA